MCCDKHEVCASSVKFKCNVKVIISFIRIFISARIFRLNGYPQCGELRAQGAV